MKDSGSAARLASGVTLGPYQVLSLLGAGGMGEVYRARDPRLNREVAVKVLPPAFAADADRLRRFEQEARAAGALNHPNIVAVFDVGRRDDGTPYVVSELLEGETLRERLGGGAIPVKKALDWAIQAAHGLAAAHEKGIVHRDLKPENLFVLKDGRIKILDFGLAKLHVSTGSSVEAEAATATQATGSGVVLGTVGYMSPEQVRGLRLDHRSDIFSFGSVLYEMLARRRAFQRETAAETMTAILKEDPPPLAEADPQLPPALDRVVRRCLEKDPEERFQSARDVAFALEALSGLSGSTVATAVVAPLPFRRRWAGLGVAAAVVAAAVLGALGGKEVWQRPLPTFHRLTHQRGFVHKARFAPDGQIVYSASWEGKAKDTFWARPETPEARSLGLPPGAIQSISPAGEMAILLEDGTLARAPLGGGAPRDVLENVTAADWSPDGKDLAVVVLDEGKSRIESPIGKKLYETSGWIEEMRVSPRGGSIAFVEHPQPNDYQGSLAVLDPSGRKRVLVEHWPNLNGMAWSARGDEIWFTGMMDSIFGQPLLYAVDLAGKSRILHRDVGYLEVLDVDRSGRAILSSDVVRMDMVGRMPGATEERRLSWLGDSDVADLSADGRSVLFGDVGGRFGSVYLRKTDGSPAVRLGDGFPWALSPDERWALATVGFPPDKLVLIPTGPGEPKVLPRENIAIYRRAAWLPDGKRVLLVASEKGRAERGWLQDVDGGKPRPVTPEGVYVAETSISPDGRFVAGIGPAGVALYPLDGGEARRVPGLAEGGLPLRWSGDGRYLYVKIGERPADVYRLDPETGRRELWREIMPQDPAGVLYVSGIRITPDGSSYVYSYFRILSSLYLAEGLR